jgi:WD40 repeat protein
VPLAEDQGAAVEQARRGVRAWVRSAGQQAGRTTPYTVLALLVAAAVAPVAAVTLGASAAYTALLGQIGAVGAGHFGGMLSDTANRLRRRTPQPSDEQWREAVAEALAPMLAADDERARALRVEVSQVLRGVDAVRVAFAESSDDSQELRQQLAAAVAVLGVEIDELRWMVHDAVAVLDGLQEDVAIQNSVHREQVDLTRRVYVAVTQLRQEVLRGPATALPATEHEPHTPPDPLAACPFPGLASFQPEDEEWFFGRDRSTAELLARLAEQVAGGAPLVVTGASGVGKSSLVRAGLLPAVARGGLPVAGSESWPWLLMTPGAKPLTELAARTAALAGVSAVDALRQLRDGPDAYGALATQAALAAQAPDGPVDDRGPRLVVVVDQFEELFTLCADAAERELFATALASAGPALVVLAVRSDFFPQCTRLRPLLPALAAGPAVVSPLGVDELRSAVVGPAERAGLELEPGLVELLLAELGARDGGYESGAVPLLAHALRSTWLRRQGRRLTIEGYRSAGGVRDAVADTAERIYVSLDDSGKARLRAGLLGLVAIVDGAGAVRRRGPRSSMTAEVLDRLVRARLVTADANSIEISHEVLLSAWPRLADWLEQDRHAIVTRQRLAEAAHYWVESDEDSDAVYRGARLAAAQDWAAGRDDVGEVEQRFLAASEAAAEAVLVSERQRGRRLRRLAAGLATALAVAVAAAGFAVEQRSEAQRRADDALSRQYAAESLASADGDQERAIRLALDAWRTSQTPQARGALLSAQMLPFTGRLGTQPGGVAVALNGDGTRVAIGHGDGAVRLWDAADHRLLRELTGHGAQVASVAFAPDGTLLATGALEANGVRIWDADSGQLVRVLRGAGFVAWLPDGKLAAFTFSASEKPVIGIFDARTGATTAELPVGDIVSDLGVSPDGRYLAAGLPTTGGIRVWRLSDRAVIADLRVNRAEFAVPLAFSPTGEVAGAGLDGEIQIWRLPDGAHVRTLRRLEGGTVGQLTYTQDGFLLATGGGRDLAAWDADTGVPVTSYTGFGGTPLDVAVAANGKVVAATGIDDTTILWRRATAWLPHPAAAFDARFDPTGRRLATSAADGVVRLWDTESRTVVATLPHEAAVDYVAWSPDGTLASATVGGTVRLWGADGKERHRFTVAPLRPGSLAFTPDGGTVAVAAGRPLDTEGTGEQPGPEYTLHVWDARTGAERTVVDLGTAGTSAITFTRDGAHLLAATYDQKIVEASGTRTEAVLRRWRTDDLTELASVPMGDEQVTDLSVSPDNRTLAVVGTGRSVRLWRLDGSGGWRTFAEHPAQLREAAFSPDGATLATITRNDTVIRLWDVRTGTLSANLTGQTSLLNAVDFAPDGNTLATAAAGASVGLWTLDVRQVIDRLCRVLGDHPSC